MSCQLCNAVAVGDEKGLSVIKDLLKSFIEVTTEPMVIWGTYSVMYNVALALGFSDNETKVLMRDYLDTSKLKEQKSIMMKSDELEPDSKTLVKLAAKMRDILKKARGANEGDEGKDKGQSN